MSNDAMREARKRFIAGYGGVGNTKFHVMEGWDAAMRFVAAHHAPTGADALTDFDLIEHAKDHAGVSTATGDESDIEFHFDREDMLSCLRALLAKRGGA